jgi:L-rhamnose mutarotase
VWPPFCFTNRLADTGKPVLFMKDRVAFSRGAASMKKHRFQGILGALVVVLAVHFGGGGAHAAEGQQIARKAEDKEKVQRFGAVIELRPEKKDYYIELHAKTWPSVLEQIRESNIRNYSIYLAELGGKLYLFAYYEYVGDDLEADMAKMAEDPETQRWWKETDPCQKRLPGTPDGQQWLKIPEVFHTD